MSPRLSGVSCDAGRQRRRAPAATTPGRSCTLAVVRHDRRTAMERDPARAAAAAGSSHSGVSWSSSVSSTAAVAGASGAGGARPPPASQTRPGRAIASSTARKHACAPATGSAKPGCNVCGAHVRMFRMAKNCTLVAAAFARDCRRGAPAAPRQRRDHVRVQCNGCATGPAAAHRAAPPVPPAARRARRHRRARPAPSPVRTVQRVTVISPRLNGAPPPPARPRTITSPASGPRSLVCAARPHAVQQRGELLGARRAPAPPSSDGARHAVRWGPALVVAWLARSLSDV